MDFELTEEMKMLKETAAKFTQTEIAPVAHECDVEERYTPEIHKKAAEIGLVGAWVPEEYGGAGVGFLGDNLISEETSKASLGINMNIVFSVFGSQVIYYYGTEEQKKKYLPPLCKGDLVCAGAFTEPDAGTDVAGYKTRAVKDGSDYIINGSKMFISGGNICDFYVAVCMTHPDEKKRHNRFSVIVIPADAEGITKTKIRGKMCVRQSDTAEIAFEDVRIPQENLIGTEKRGFHQMMHFFGVTRLPVAAQGLGLSQACLAESIKYAKERTSFGAPIASYQMTQYKLTEMAIMIEALRGLLYKASWLVDVGRPDFHFNAMAKYYAGQTGVFCANKAVEIHGGYGFIDEYPVEMYYRDAKVLQIYEGANEAEILSIGSWLVSK